ncbi:MAG: hypothetical protein Q8941_08545 [Bacteroidota bacterium]|nr:hypothetical protein [Bacteroidota bacterium]
MEEKMKVPQGTKETLLSKAGTVTENVKEKVKGKAEELVSKAKESELAEKAKGKLGNLKEGAKDLLNKVADKFPGKK